MFRSLDTLKSHHTHFHRRDNNKEVTDDTTYDSSSSSDSSEDDTAEDTKGRLPHVSAISTEDAGDESDNDEPCETNDSQPESEDEELALGAWRDVMKEAIANMNWQGTTEDLMKEPNYAELHQQLGEAVFNYIDRAETFQCSTVISEVINTAEKKKKELKCEDWEAMHAAWDARKYWVVPFLTEHILALVPNE